MIAAWLANGSTMAAASKESVTGKALSIRRRNAKGEFGGRQGRRKALKALRARCSVASRQPGNREVERRVISSSACQPLPEGKPLAIPVHIGTCAWSFDEWHGVFYPDHLPANERLAWYAKALGSVEIDSTFYATPSPETARHWCKMTPADFVCTCKMPKTITHERKLRDCREPLAEFLHGIEPLMPKLAAVLLQFPAYFKRNAGDEMALREFLSILPRTVRFAVEFRDAGWHLPRIANLLEEHSVAWVWNDITPLAHQNEAPFDFAPLTTDFIYLEAARGPRHQVRGDWSTALPVHEAEMATRWCDGKLGGQDSAARRSGRPRPNLREQPLRRVFARHLSAHWRPPRRAGGPAGICPFPRGEAQRPTRAGLLSAIGPDVRPLSPRPVAAIAGWRFSWSTRNPLCHSRAKDAGACLACPSRVHF